MRSSLLFLASCAASTLALRRRAEFTLANGQDAQQLNADFAALTAQDDCTAGEQACVNGDFAQCIQGVDLSFSFAVTPCAAGVQCFALPLVNKRGTSIACTTESDALSRIAASGAQGGLTGNGTSNSGSGRAGSPSPSLAPAPAQCGAATATSSESNDAATETATADSPPATETSAAGTPSTSASTGQGFVKQNGLDAEAANQRFASLTADSSCSGDENACVNDQFAQCVSGNFVLTPCSGGTICRSLPLVKKPGTSNTCTTEADTAARIATALQG